jgi:hypothetical protein
MELVVFDAFNIVLIFVSTFSFFVYTFPGEEDELFIKASLLAPIGDVDAKLLYFLDFELKNGKSLSHA